MDDTLNVQCFPSSASFLLPRLVTKIVPFGSSHWIAYIERDEVRTSSAEQYDPARADLSGLQSFTSLLPSGPGEECSMLLFFPDRNWLIGLAAIGNQEILRTRGVSVLEMIF